MSAALDRLRRLDLAALDRAPRRRRTAGVSTRPSAGIGIVHLGIGAFHRAHQAVYTDDALARAGGRWGICGVSLRSADVRDRLAPQDGLYTSIEKSPAACGAASSAACAKCCSTATSATPRPARSRRRETRIVSLTVTEKGYCHDPATGRARRRSHPDIAHDLAHPARAAQRRRPARRGARRAPAHARRAADRALLRQPAAERRAGLRAGRRVRAAARCRAGATGSAARSRFRRRWSTASCRRRRRADIAENDAALGARRCRAGRARAVRAVGDRGPLRRRPAGVGCRRRARSSRDVEPFEAMKLRLLNAQPFGVRVSRLSRRLRIHLPGRGAAGVRRVHAPLHGGRGVADARRRRRASTSRAIATRWCGASPIPRCRIARSRSRWTARRSCRSECSRPIRDNLAANRSVELATLAVAGWMRYVYGEDEQGRPIEVSDPLAPRFAAIAARASRRSRRVRAGAVRPSRRSSTRICTTSRASPRR